MWPKLNEKLNGTFKGTLQEKHIQANSTGRFSMWKIFFVEIKNILEIPVTIYTPIDVDKNKWGIYFHGCGKIIRILLLIMINDLM